LSESDLEVAPGIRLSSLRAEHAVALAALVDESREELGRWLPFVRFSHGPADILAFIEIVDERRARTSAEMTFTILADGSPAGVIEMHEPSRVHNLASVGCWLGTRFTGRGIMTMSLNRLSAFAFEAHGIHRLELYAAVDNVKSRRVAERAGFTFEAILRERLKYHEQYLDAALYVRFAETLSDAPTSTKDECLRIPGPRGGRSSVALSEDDR
jgi:ribosomal-protein-serine acetyltransferase